MFLLILILILVLTLILILKNKYTYVRTYTLHYTTLHYITLPQHTYISCIYTCKCDQSIYIYIYMIMCVCVFVCVILDVRDRYILCISMLSMWAIKNKVIAGPFSAPPASVSLPLASRASEAGIDLHRSIRSNPFNNAQDIQDISRVTLAWRNWCEVKQLFFLLQSLLFLQTEAAFALAAAQTLALYTDHNLSVDNKAKLTDFKPCHCANLIKAGQQTPGLRTTHSVFAWV